MTDTELLAARFQTALDLWATGVVLQRQTFRREHPDASPDQIESLVNRWLQHRPGAEWGDGPRPVAR